MRMLRPAAIIGVICLSLTMWAGLISSALYLVDYPVQALRPDVHSGGSGSNRVPLGWC